MTTPDPRALTEDEAAALDRLRTADLYTDRSRAAADNDPRLALPPLLRAVAGRVMSQVFAQEVHGTEPDHRPADVEDALALIRCARSALDQVEGGLLLTARQMNADGKPLLTFRRIADALGVESEQAAQGRYRRRIGNLNGSDSGIDGIP